MTNCCKCSKEVSGYYYFNIKPEFPFCFECFLELFGSMKYWTRIMQVRAGSLHKNGFLLQILKSIKYDLTIELFLVEDIDQFNFYFGLENLNKVF